jgi:hypothetical protein
MSGGILGWQIWPKQIDGGDGKDSGWKNKDWIASLVCET